MTDEARLQAHTAAFLWTSRLCFERATLFLARQENGELEPDTGRLASSLSERHQRARGHGFVVSGVAALRDSVWFGASPPGTKSSLHEILCRIVSGRLQHRGDVIGLAEGPDATHEWRVLTLHLPADLLLVSAFAAQDLEPTTDLPDVRHPLLLAWLNDKQARFASLHTHVAAGVPFHALWSSLQGALATGTRAEEVFPVPLEEENKARLFAELMAAAVVRLALARTLGEEREPIESALRALSAAATEPGAAESAARFLRRPAVPIKDRWLDQWRSVLSCAHRRRWPQKLRDQDPLACRAPAHLHGETWLMHRALLGLKRGSLAPDGFATCLFWQAQRVRCRVFAQLTQRADQKGLEEFFRSFQRIKGIRRRAGPRECAAETTRHAKRHCAALSSVEVRTSFQATTAALDEELRALSAGMQAADATLERGVVLHFQKARLEASTGQPHAAPGHSFRYASWLAARRIELSALEDLVTRKPETIAVVRGFDVCSDETAIPFWAVRAVVSRARALGERAAHTCGKKGRTIEAPRVTLHLGEDFPRLLTGLRAIGEPLDARLLRGGDRIGHGLALGLDVATALEDSSSFQPREQRLFDLLWVLERTQTRHIEIGGLLRRIEEEALALGTALFMDRPDISLPRLHNWRRSLLRFTWRQDCPSPSTDVGTFLRSSRCFAKAIEPIRVTPEAGEATLLKLLQEDLRAQVAGEGITVEVLPSSNLIVGGLRTLDDHPFFRLQPLPHRLPDGPVVDVSLGDDDPTTFATSFGEEWTYLFATMLRRKVAVPDALAWLEKARASGWKARFTLPLHALPTTRSEGR